MRYFLSLLLFVVGSIVSVAQQRTIILTESSLPYTEQQWFSNFNFPEDDIEKCWNEGKRIHAAAYTSRGWIFSMAKNTGYTKQAYYTPDVWPEKWIDDKWADGYRITDLAYGDGKWLVVMSQNSGLTKQAYNSNRSWNEIYKWIDEKKENGYMITSLTHTGTHWVVVMSQNSQYKSQGNLFASTSKELVSKVENDVWGKGYRVHKIEYGNDKYLVIYGKYASDNERRQYFWATDENPKSFIADRWNESKEIAYFGGGLASKESNNYVASNNQQSNNNNSNNKSKNDSKNIHVDLPNGGYTDYHWDDEGTLYTTTVTPCIWCKGTKMCFYCNGSKTQFLYGMWSVCKGCNGLGLCTHCNGQGHTTSYSVTDTGGNTNLMTSDGYMAYGNAGGAIVTRLNGKVSAYSSGSGGGSSKSSSGSSRTQCPKCNGRKYETTAYTYAAASASGWAQPYHHTGIGSCPYCNRQSSHYHYPCTECSGHGRVKR